MDDLPATNKNLGQHWLTDEKILQEIASSADVTAADTVLEVGPGPGTLTNILVKQAKQVVAVEFDPKLARELASKTLASNLKVVEQDILRFDLTTLPKDYKVVANIPYYLTSKLVRVLSESPNQAAVVVLLIQKEVAERICAKAGDMSLLSVSAQFYWDVRPGIDVPAKFFTPPPKVDSRVVILKRRPKALFLDVNNREFFQLVKAGFSSRRKTLLNSLSGGLRKTKPEVLEMLASVNLDPNLRPQNLSLDEWHQLYKAKQQG